jgi:hypothetical protein
MKMMEVNNKGNFLIENPNLKHLPYEKILKEFQRVFYAHLFKGKTIETPLGNFEVIRFKPSREFKKKPIDFKATREEGFTIRHLNEHTNGYACMVNFTPKGVFERYKFKTVRVLARSLAAYILQNIDAYKLYYEVSKHKYSNIQARTTGSGTTPNS